MLWENGAAHAFSRSSHGRRLLRRLLQLLVLRPEAVDALSLLIRACSALLVRLAPLFIALRLALRRVGTRAGGSTRRDLQRRGTAAATVYVTRARHRAHAQLACSGLLARGGGVVARICGGGCGRGTARACSLRAVGRSRDGRSALLVFAALEVGVPLPLRVEPLVLDTRALGVEALLAPLKRPDGWSCGNSGSRGFRFSARSNGRVVAVFAGARRCSHGCSESAKKLALTRASVRLALSSVTSSFFAACSVSSRALAALVLSSSRCSRSLSRAASSRAVGCEGRPPRESSVARAVLWEPQRESVSVSHR